MKADLAKLRNPKLSDAAFQALARQTAAKYKGSPALPQLQKALRDIGARRKKGQQGKVGAMKADLAKLRNPKLSDAAFQALARQTAAKYKGSPALPQLQKALRDIGTRRKKGKVGAIKADLVKLRNPKLSDAAFQALARQTAAKYKGSPALPQLQKALRDIGARRKKSKAVKAVKGGARVKAVKGRKPLLLKAA